MYASSYGDEPAADTPSEAVDDGAGVKPSGADGEPQRVSVRFLLSAASAGSIIGKGGAVITEFEAQSGARIQLSKPKECFPGTSDRSAWPRHALRTRSELTSRSPRPRRAQFCC
jgi:hypothetical protein